MASGANWLVLDEPTNHLDLPAIEQLETRARRLRRHAAARHPRPAAARRRRARPHDRPRRGDVDRLAAAFAAPRRRRICSADDGAAVSSADGTAAQFGPAAGPDRRVSVGLRGAAASARQCWSCSTVLMASLALVWVATYAVARPAGCRRRSPSSTRSPRRRASATFARTRRFALFRRSQLLMSLLLPFALQWSLGGFENASAVCLWGFTSPLGALLFVGARQAVPWFAAFAGARRGLGRDRLHARRRRRPTSPSGVVITFFALNILGVAATAYRAAAVLRARARARAGRVRAPAAQRAARARGERGSRRTTGSSPTTTPTSRCCSPTSSASPRSRSGCPPPSVVALLDRVFARWDALAAEHGVEKIKTIGDAYMVAGGIPLPRADHAEAIAELALAMGPRVGLRARRDRACRSRSGSGSTSAPSSPA